MAEKKQLDQLLNEFTGLTGIPMELPCTGGDDPEEMAERMSMLISAWKDKYDRGGFIKGMIDGSIPENQLLARASGFHIPLTGRRRVYAIECPENATKEALKVLRAMFIRKSGDLAEMVGEGQLVLIRPEGDADDSGSAWALSHTIADMLAAEIMAGARIGYADPVDSLTAVAASYRDARRALTIGALFNMSESVFSYKELGIGRLVYDLPDETCRVYLRELFGNEEGPHFDEDTEVLIAAFYENNLNIAETARKLFLHRNTLVYRLEKLKADTGFDLRSFADAEKLHLAMMIGMRLRALNFT